MYLPRHYKVDKKKGPNYWKYLWILLIIIPVYFLFSYRKKLSLYFTSNHQQKQLKAEKKLQDQFFAKKLTKEAMVEYITTSSNLLQSEPASPRSSHAIAKGYYYYLLMSGFKFNIHNLLGFIAEDSNNTLFFEEKYEILDGMYRNAIRSDSLADEYPEQNSNRLLILLYEILEGRRNANFILEDLKKINFDRIAPEVRQIYTWLNFISSTNSGNLTELNSIYEKNKSIGQEGGIEISDREFTFLKGITAYKSKDYIQALEFLRASHGELDFITIEATKTEAMIFFYQNLHDKAIALLEQLFIDLNGTDETIKPKLEKIVSSKAGLKSKLL